MAVASYHAANGHYPPPYIADEHGRPMHSWRVLLLPYLGCEELYAEYNFSEPWNGPNNSRLAVKMPHVYALFGEYEEGLTITSYLAVVGPETAWPTDRKLSEKEIADGPWNTIAIVENRGAGIHWMAPQDLSLSEMSLEVNSPRGVSSVYVDPAVVMLDGHLRRLDQDLSPDTLRALLTANGGEMLRDFGGGWEMLVDGRQRTLALP